MCARTASLYLPNCFTGTSATEFVTGLGDYNCPSCLLSPLLPFFRFFAPLLDPTDPLISQPKKVIDQRLLPLTRSQIHVSSITPPTSPPHDTSPNPIQKLPVNRPPTFTMPRQTTTNREDFAKYTKNGTIKLIIGPIQANATPSKDQIFHLYRDLLSALSPYFAAKLTADHNNANNGPATPGLPNDNGPLFVPDQRPGGNDGEITTLLEPNLPLAAFNWFINWMYNKPLSPLVRDHALTVDTYLLAQTLMAERFRNDIVDALRRHHANNPDDQLGLRSMLKLADRMPPEDKANEGRNKLLEFLTAQMTYKSIVKTWEGGGFYGNGLVKRLLGGHREVTMWHREGIDAMLEQTGFNAAMQDLAEGVARVKLEGGGSVGDAQDEDVKGGIIGKNGAGVVKTKRPVLRLPENPAEKIGCVYHEHKERGSRCGNATVID